jgi:hypothetical protein
MDYPDDLPWIIYWRTRVPLQSLPRRVVTSISTSGVTDANIVRPQIPYGASGWRLRDDQPWQPMDSLPKHWLPFLDRERGTALDPRPKLEK